ncbi:MAG TPA: serine/threonine-protein kinase [Phycisphaerales bacterium]|nr:serine/threonine-protein kinase [Phycisphaerales bacterium]
MERGRSEVQRCAAEAAGLESAARGTYLRSLWARDPVLASDVERALAGDEGETLAPAARPALDRDGAGRLTKGARIGAYALIEVLGEGGFGVVWRAEQREPVRREVALKVVKPGMDSAAVLSRFESERQTLAVMDHPYVAKVFDAGVTGPESGHAGLPYFVMELVRGEPITDYCERARLAVGERLELFMKVCEAVQHAHTKAVIHRDLKPSNVLVSLHGNEASPKVIDFGVAKALSSIGAHTLVTEAGALIGTPEYMSPEQAGGSFDIDTRSDIYSLGVILYELLTGGRPFDLRTATLMEIQRVILEDDPPRPSTRLISRARGAARSGDEPGADAPGSKEFAAHMRTDSRSLLRVLRTDLDWIVMKCLEKDRARRYESASSLAEDLRRYMQGRPVAAGPPTAAYRARKFVRRHRAGVAAAAVVALTLLGAMAAVSAGLVREATLRKRAETERDTSEAIAGFLRDTLAGVRPSEARGREVTVREMLDRARQTIDRSFGERPAVAGRVRNTMGESYLALAEFEEAERQFRAAYQSLRDAEGERDPETLNAMNNLGVALHDLGRLEDAETLQRESVALHRETLGLGHEMTLSAEVNLASVLQDRGEADGAADMYQAVLDRLPDRASPTAWNALTGLAIAAKDAGDLGRALPLYQEVYEGAAAALGEDHPDTIIFRGNYSNALVAADRWDEALALMRGAVERAERVFEPGHANRLIAYNNLAMLLQDFGRLDEARGYYEKVLADAPRTFERSNPMPARAMVNAAVLSYRTGDFPRAETLLREAVGWFDAAVGSDDPEAMDARTSLAVILDELGRAEEAARLHREVYEATRARFGADSPRTLAAQSELAAYLRDSGEYGEADELFTSALEGQHRVLGETHDQTLLSTYQYIGLLTRMERWEDALRRSEWLVARIDGSLPPSHPVAMLAHFRLGASLTGLGRHEEAERALLESWRRLDAVEGISPSWKAYVAEALLTLYEKWAREPDARQWRDRLTELQATNAGG